MTKEMCEERINLVCEKSEGGNYNYEVKTSDWDNYGKSRTYFSIVETRENSKHFVKRDYGYFDNNTESYVAGKNDMFKDYTFSGSKF